MTELEILELYTRLENLKLFILIAEKLLEEEKKNEN